MHRLAAECEKSARDLGDDLLHLVVRGVKGSRIVLGTPFDGECEHLGQRRVDAVTAVGVVVGATGGRIQVRRLLKLVATSSSGSYRGLHCSAQTDKQLPVIVE